VLSQGSFRRRKTGRPYIQFCNPVVCFHSQDTRLAIGFSHQAPTAKNSSVTRKRYDYRPEPGELEAADVWEGYVRAQLTAPQARENSAKNSRATLLPLLTARFPASRLSESWMQLRHACFRPSSSCQAEPPLWPFEAELAINVERCLGHARYPAALSRSLWLSACLPTLLSRPVCIEPFRGCFTFVPRRLPRRRPMPQWRCPPGLTQQHCISAIVIAIALWATA
jgi:hypothetical protein